MPLADAINGYRLFLGREPESERVAQDKAMFPMPKMLASFVGSREFSERILVPLASGYPLPHFRVSAFPHAEMRAWAGEVLPIAPATREKLLGAKTWRQLLTAIVCDAGFSNKFGRLGSEDLLPAIRRRESTGRKADQEREIVGWVDETSMFEIRGWAANLLDPDEQLRLEFFLDNLFVGTIQTSEFRRDLQEKIGGKGNFAFFFNVPAAHHPDLQVERLLTVRDSVSHLPIALPVRIKLGQTEALDSLLRIRREVENLAVSLEKLESALPAVLANTEYPLSMYNAYQNAAQKALRSERAAHVAEGAALPISPHISVILCGKGEAPASIMASVNSLRRQTYSHWECVIALPLLEDETRTLVETLSSTESRIRVAEIAPLSPGWAAANEGAHRSLGEYLIWLNEGDFLAEDALLELARALQNQQPLLYFDEDLFQRESGKLNYLSPVLKTAFDLDHLLSRNYIGNAFVCSRRLFEELAGFRGDFGGAYEYDFLLRVAERLTPNEIRHLDRILYHRKADGAEDREPPEGTDRSDLQAGVACVNAHLERIGANATAEPHSDPFGAPRSNAQRVIWRLPEPAPVVSIIIPTRDRAELLAPCLKSVFDSQVHYPAPFEIIVMDNESCEPETHALFEQIARDNGVEIIPYRSAFNWSAINNSAARRAKGEILLFLNNDTMVLSPDWVRELASNAARPDVGAVGARLLYQDGTIQHGGVVLGGRAVHEGIGQRPGDGGYLGRTALQRNASAVTGACIATRKALFLELGGFDETNLKVAFNDVDYCLKVRAAGYAVIYTPFATLYHFESKSRGLDDDFSKRLRSQNELRIMQARWRDGIDADPFYNARFTRTGRPFTRLRPAQLMGQLSGTADDEELWEYE